LSNRSTAKYLGLLALAVGLFYWKTMLTSQFTLIVGSEPTNMTYSWLTLWVNSIRHFQLPLWDPYVFAGRPFAGEMLTSAFFPLHLVLVLIPFNRDGLFSPRLYDEWFVLMHLLGAWFAFALLREFDLARFASFLGACCFALTGFLGRIIWVPYVESGIWLPLIFLFLLRALRAPDRRSGLFAITLSGGCLGLSILAGGLHLALMQGIVVVTASAYWAAREGLPWTVRLSPRSHWLQVALLIGVFAAVAACLGAVQLLPSMEYSHLSLRFINGGAFPSSEKIPYDRMNDGMWPQSILGLLFPTAFDGKMGGDENFTSPYIGVFPLFMALIAIWKRWDRPWVRYLAGLATIAFLYSLAELSPLHGILYATVPFLWLAREAGRFLYLASFALSVLAAFGLDTVFSRPVPSPDWIPARRIAIACGAALLFPALYSQFTVSIWTAYSLLLILASCGWFAYLMQHPAGPFVRVLLVIFILVDLDSFHWTEAYKSQLSKSGANTLEQLVSLKEPMRFLKSQPGLFRARVAGVEEPNFADAYGVASVWGGGGTVLTDYSQIRDREDLLNVRYRVVPSSNATPSPLYNDGRWKIFENPRAYPRAWVVHQAVQAPSQQVAVQRTAAGDLDLRRAAILSSSLPASLGHEPSAPEDVRFQSYQPGRIDLNVTTESPGLLILSEAEYPGWRATVNGRSAPILKVDGALRGIGVGAGANRISLSYVPVITYAGGVTSVLAFLWVLFAAYRSHEEDAFRQYGPKRTLQQSAFTQAGS
jgi:hypothetical protein